LQVIAPGALAGMLLYTGFEHGLLASRVRGGFERAVVASVGLVTLLAGNLALGFLAGAVLLGARRAARAASGAGAAGARPGAAAPRRWRASGVEESAGPAGASGVPARGMGGEVTT